MNKYMLIFRGQDGVDTSDTALKERISLHVNWIKKLGDQHIDSTSGRLRNTSDKS